ncbi:hypothetical protein ACJX0J_041879, partial [Zea mays]
YSFVLLLMVLSAGGLGLLISLNEQANVDSEVQQVEVDEQELIKDDQATVDSEVQQIEVAEQELIE